MSKVQLTKEEFKKIRELLGDTQGDFAKRLGYKTFITISYKESGTRNISAQDELLLREYIPRVRTLRKKVG